MLRRLLFFFLISIGFLSSSWGQTFTLEAERALDTSKDSVIISVYVQSSSDDVMGSSDFIFHIDTAAVDIENGRVDQSASTFYNTGSYEPLTLGSNYPFAYFRLGVRQRFPLVNPGINVLAASRRLVGDVIFPIKDKCRIDSLDWNLVPSGAVQNWTGPVLTNKVTPADFLLRDSISGEVVISAATDTLCQGADVDIAFLLNGEAPLDVDFGNGTDVENATGLGNADPGQLYTPSTTGLTIYQITQITDRNGCVQTDATFFVDDSTFVDQIVTASNAGPDDSVCVQPKSYTLAANSPAIGLGTWTANSTEAVFADITDPTSNVDVDSGGYYYFNWTIASPIDGATGACPSSEDSVRVRFFRQPSPAITTGIDTCVVGIPVTFDLIANAIDTGIGTWSINTAPPGPAAVFGDENDPNSSFTANVAGAYQLLWTVTNGNCPPEVSAPTGINVETPANTPTISTPDGSQCEETIVLNSNNVAPSSGSWSTLSSAQISSITSTSPTITFPTYTFDSTFTLYWNSATALTVCPTLQDSVLIERYAQPDIANTISGNALPDCGTTENYTLTPNGTSQYGWILPNGYTIGSLNAADSSDIDIDFADPSFGGDLIATETTTNGCFGGIDTLSITPQNCIFQASFFVNNSANPDTAVCTGDVVTLISNSSGVQLGTTDFTWDTTGTTFLSGIDEDTVQITFDGPGLKTLKLEINNPSTDDTTIQLQVIDPPNLDLTHVPTFGPVDICSGDSVGYRLAVTGGLAPYTVTLDTGAGNIVYNNIQSGDTVWIQLFDDKTITPLSITDQLNCGSGTVGGEGPQVVSVNPLPAGTLSNLSSSPYCSTDSVELRVDFTLGTGPFDIKINANGSLDTLITGAGTDPYDFFVPTDILGTVTYSLDSITDNNGCSSGNSTGTVTVTVNPGITDVTVTGGTTICEGENDTITIDVTGGAPNYTYYFEGLSPTSALTSFNIVYAPSADSTVTIDSVRTAAGCAYVSGATATTTVNPLPTADIVGDNTICSGESTDLIFTTDLGTNDIWYSADVDGIQPVQTGNGTVTVSPTATNIYTIDSVIAATGCAVYAPSPNITGSATITVNPGITNVTIGGGDEICFGENDSIAIVITGGTGPYFLHFGSGSGDISNYTSGDSLSYTPASTTIWLLDSVTDALGCVFVSGASTTTTVNPLPTADISGTATICEGGPGTDLTFALTGSGTDYDVTYTDGFNIFTAIGIANGATINVNPSQDSTYEILDVTANSTGCYDTIPSANITGSADITVNPSTAPTVSISQSPGNPFCTGDNVTFTVTATDTTASPVWSWILNDGATVSTTNSYTTNTLSDADEVKVILDVSGVGCAVPDVVSDSVIVDVQANVTPTVTLTQIPGNLVCDQDTLMFIAQYTGVGPSPTIRWFRDATPLGAATFDLDTLIRLPFPDQWDPGQVWRVRVTSSLACATTPFVEDQVIPATATNVTPFVEIVQSPSNPVCVGDMVTFNTNVNGQGSNPSYQWILNGTPQSDTTSTFTFTPGVTGQDQIEVVLTSSASCALTPTDADTVLLNTQTNVTPSISFTQTPAGAVCPGTDITFNSTYSGGGTNPSVEWYVNNVLQAISDDFTLVNPTDGDIVRVDLVSSSSCASPTTVSSQSTIQVQTPVEPVANIIQTPGNPVCIGDQVQFDADVTGQGNNPNYLWYYNGTQVATGVTQYIRPSVANGDDVRLIVINTAPCSVKDRDTADIVINAVGSVPLTATIIQSPAGDSLCVGESVTFTANITGGGANPSYQWSYPLPLGGTIQSTDPSWTTTVQQAGGNFISLNITSSLSCASPTSYQPGKFFIGTGSGVTPTVDIIQNPGNPTCPGDPIDFSVNATGEGTSPLYDWYLNGALQVSNSTGLYTLNGASDGDEVVVELTSNICSGSSTARDTIIINQQPIINPTVEIDVSPDDTICTGTQFLSFTANPTGEGANPSYQWFLNNTLVSNGTIYNASVNGGDEVVVVLTKALPCGGFTTASDTVEIVAISGPASADIVQIQSASCNGDLVEFEADVFGMSIPLTYIWNLNGSQVGSGETLTIPVSNGDNLELIVNSTVSICGNATTANDIENISGLASGSQTPTTSIEMNPDNPICPGEDLILSSIDSFEGVNPSYKWYVNGALEVVDEIFLTNQLVDGDTVILELTSSASCANPSLAYDTLPIKFIQTAIDTADTTTFCYGDSVILNIEDTMNVTAEWFSIDGSSLGTGFDITIFDSDSVYALIDNGRCTESTDTIIVTVYRPYSKNITASGPTNLCFGDEVTLSIPDSTGLTFQWLYGFDTLAGETDTTLTVDYTGSFNIIAQNNVCIDTIGSVNVQVAPPIDSTVSIIRGDSIFCEGDSALIGISSVMGNALGGTNGSSYVQTTYNGVLNNGDRTLEAWIRTDTAGGIAGYGTFGVGTGFLLRINNVLETPANGVNGALKLAVGGGYITGTTPINDNLPHHVAVVFSGDSLYDAQLYVDGQLEVISSASLNIELNTTAGTNLRIGTANVGFTPIIRFGGRIDEVRFWDVALDSASINNNKDVPLIGIEPGLVGLWNFEDTTQIADVPDEAGANDGTFNAGARIIPEGGFYTPSPAVTYTWYEAISNTIVQGPAPSPGFLFWADSSGDYYVEVNNNGCTQTSDTISIQEVILDPVITNTSPEEACFGETVTLNSTNTLSTLDSIEWIYGSNNLITGTDSVLNVTATGVYSVVYHQSGCSDTSNAIVVNIAPEIDTTMTIDGDTALCNDDTTYLSVPLYGGNHLRTLLDTSVIRDVANIADLSFIHTTGRFTLQYWHKLVDNQNNEIKAALGNAFSGSPGFFAGYQRGNVGGINLPGTRLKLHVDPDGVNDFVYSSSPGSLITATDSSWHQITITLDSNEAVFYFDGVKLPPPSFAFGPIDYSGAIPATNELTIGDADSYTSGFNNLTARGGVDEVRIWNVPLDSATIANNWNRPLNGDEPGLVALFDLDEDSASVDGDLVNDLTVNAYTGTLNQGARLVGFDNSMPSNALSYQWYRDNILLPNDTLNTLAVTDSGDYFVVITSNIGSNCSDTSRVVEINKYPIDPQLNVLSVTDTACFGDSVELQAVNGSGSLDSVIWLYSGVPVSMNNPFDAGLSGSYRAVVYRNVCNDTTTYEDVVILPEIKTNVSIYGDTVLCAGDSVILSAPQYGSGSIRMTNNLDHIENIGSTNDYRFVHETGTFSIEYYGKMTDLAAPGLKIAVGNSKTNGEFGFSAGIQNISGANRFFARFNTPIGNSIIRSDNAVVTDTNWHHYVISSDSGDVKMYVDGVEITALNNSNGWGPSIAPSSNLLSIGQLLPGGLWPGALDEIRIWNIPITEEQILANIGRPINGDAGLVSLWNFDSDTSLTTGDQVFDAYGGISGTISNDAKITLDNPFLPGDLSYTWYNNGAIVAGPGNLSSITVGDSGYYHVEIDNNFGCGPAISDSTYIQQNLISDTLFAMPTEFCYGTDSARIWVDLNVYDSLEIYDTLGGGTLLTTITSATDTFYIDSTQTIYGLVFNTLDGKTCSQLTDTITITAFENPTITFASDSLVICIDDSDSLFAFSKGDTIFGGTPFGGPPYIYDWSPGDSLNGNDSTLLQPVYTASFAGEETFVLTIEDANGCISTDSIRVITYPRVEPDLGPDTVIICYGDTIGLADGFVAINGGKPGTDFSYQWDSDSLFLDPALDTTLNPQIVGLVPGLVTYIIEVTDTSTGCLGYDTITVYVNDSLSFNAFDDTLICFTTPSITLGALNGDSTAEGGTGSLSYVWSPGTNLSDPNISTPNFINPLVAGVYEYFIDVTDSLGCSRMSDTIKVEVAPEIILDAGNDTLLCFGDTTHTLGGTPTASGGFNTFSYEWSTIAPAPAANTLLNDISLSNPTVLYTSALIDSIQFVVTVVDTAALPRTTLCELTDTVTIQFNPEIVADTGMNNFVCFDDTISLDGSASGGSGSGFIYAWAGDNQYVVDTTDNQSLVNGDESGSYNLELFAFDIDNPQCFDTASFVFEINDTLMVDAGMDTSICYGQLVELGGIISGTTDTTASNDVGGFIYSWTGFTAFLTSTSIKNPIFGGVTSDPSYTYYVSVADANGCIEEDSIVIQINPEITPVPIANDSICLNDTTTLGGSSIALGGFDGTFTYNWTSSQGNTITTNTDQNPLFTADVVGVDSIKVITTDPAGCFDSSEFLLEVNPLPSIAFSTADNFYICRGQDTTLIAIGTPIHSPTDVLDYEWNNGVANDTNIVSPFDDTLYIVEVINQFTGCSNFDTIDLDVEPLPDNQIDFLTTPSNPHPDTLTVCLNAGIVQLTTYNDSSTRVFNQWTTLDPPGPASGGTGQFLTFASNQIGSNGNNIENFYIDNNGCENRDTVFITTNSLPDAEFYSSDTVICYGDMVTLTVEGGPDPITAIYSFNRTDPGFENINTGMDTTVTFAPGVTDFLNINTTDTLTYTVQIQELLCTSEISLNIVVNPLPALDSILIPNFDTVCFGQDIQLSLENTLPTPFAPLDSFAWAHTAIINDTVTVGIFSDSIFSVIAWDTNGCSDGTSYDIKVKQLPDTSLNYSGTVEMCEGDTTNLHAVYGNAGFTYEWKDLTGTSPGQGPNNNNIFSADTSGQYYVVITTDGTVQCSDSSNVVTIIDNPLPVIVLDTLPDTANFCFGEDVLISELSAYPTYVWKDSATGTIVGSTNSLTIDTTAQVYVVVTDANGCIDSSSTQFFTEQPLSNDSVDSGEYEPCAWSTETYTSNVVGIWVIDRINGEFQNGINIGPNSVLGAGGASGLPTDVAVIDWKDASNTFIRFFPEVACADTFFRNITINPNPIAGITGQTSGCEGSILLDSAITVGVGDTYAWTLQSGANMAISSSSTDSIISITLGALTPPTTSVTDSLFLVQTNTFGCDTSAKIEIISFTSPDPTINQIGGINTGVCVGEVDTFQVANALAGATYNFRLALGSTNTITTLSPTSVSVTWNTIGTDSVILEVSNGDCFDTAFLDFSIQATPTNFVTSSLNTSNGVCISDSTISYIANANLIGATDVINWTVLGNVASPSNPDDTTYVLNFTGTGQYILTYTQTSTNGCTFTFDTTVAINAEPSLQFFGDTIVCENSSNNSYNLTGVFDRDSIEFTPGPNVTVNNWDPIGQVLNVTWGTPNLNAFVAIEYNNGACIDFDTLFVRVDAIPVAQVLPDPGVDTVFCENKITRLFASPFDSTYEYQWFLDGNIISGEDSSVIIVNEFGSGDYTVEVTTQADGCNDVSNIAKPVEILGTPVAELTTTDPTTGDTTTFICGGDSIEISLLSSAPSIEWYFDTLNPSLITTNVTDIIATIPGQYFAVLINDGPGGNGCTDTADAWILRPLGNPVNLWSLDSSFCNNDTIYLNGDNLGSQINYEWTSDGMGQIFDPSSDTTIYLPSDLDSGIVTFTFAVGNQCFTDIDTGTALIRPSPDASYTPSALVAELNELVTFTINNPNAVIYNWVYQPGASSTGEFGSHAYSTEGDYLSYLLATNEFNCTDSFAVPIHVTRNQLIYVPNVFSPNANDADNRVMKVYGTNISATGFEIVIFNRWGTKVYESTDLTELKTIGWEGKQGNGADLPTGVYTYYIKGAFFDGQSFEKVGTVSLIR